MIGQQKRSLEHSVSPQPVKYQKHFDDNFCDTSSRIASLKEEQLDCQQQCSGVPRTSPSLIPSAVSCDSLQVFERDFGSASAVPQSRGERLPELDNGTNVSSHGELLPLSTEIEASRTPNANCGEGYNEIKVEDHEDNARLSIEDTSKIDEKVESVVLFQGNGTEHSSMQALGEGLRSLDEKTDMTESCVVIPSENPSPKSGEAEHKGFYEEVQEPGTRNTNEKGFEGDAFLESVQKTVVARRPNGSRPLPVFMSDKVMNLYTMHKQVKLFGGYEAVTCEGLWGKISETLGLGQECGPGVKLIYFKYLKGVDRYRGHLPEGQPDTVQIKITGLSSEDRVDAEKDKQYSLFIGEQFAESEPFQDRRNLKDGSSYRKGFQCKESENLEDGTERVDSKREREVAWPHTHLRGDGDKGTRRIQGESTFHGSCTFAEEWDNTQGTQLADRVSKGKSEQTGARLVKREFGRDVAKDFEETERSDQVSGVRGHQSLTNTLIWMRRVALDPGNPLMGEGLEGAGQNEEWVKECASQAEKVRGLLWKRREEIRPSDGHSHQSKQIPGPSHYYEELPRPDQQSLERLRVTKERVAHYGFQASPGVHRSFHESSSCRQRGSSSVAQPQWTHHPNYRSTRQGGFLPSYNEIGYLEHNFIDRPRKRIPIGSDFQAHVTVWRSVSVGANGNKKGPGSNGDETQSSDEDEEDSRRWLGKQVWPPPGFKRVADCEQIGKGRPFSCSCLDQESVDCVRRHVQEKRERLQQELGQAFYIWKFDEMGEIVSNQWTREEERTFRTLVKMNPPSQDKNFWDQLSEAFPGRKMKDFVSYYFNIFVLRRRAMQNRIDHRRIDSDDDETELPEGDSEDSEEYDSGDEIDANAEEEDSEEDDDPEKHLDTYAAGSGGKLLEDHGYCDLGGINLIYCSTNMDAMSTEDETSDVPLTLCSTSVMGLEDAEQGYQESRREERGVRLPSTHMPSKWNHEHHDEEKHPEEHVTMVGEEEMQEVKTWEDPHWDEADHEDLAHDATAKCTASKALSQERVPSEYKKLDDRNDEQTSLVTCEGSAWGKTVDIVERNGSDRLLSTHGMIKALFGEDGSPDSDSPI